MRDDNEVTDIVKYVVNNPAALDLVGIDYRPAQRCEATRRTYADAWARFDAWCSEHHVPSLPATPEVTAAYLGTLAKSGLSWSSVRRAAAAICAEHRDKRWRSPTRTDVVVDQLRGISKAIARPKRRVDALTAVDVRTIVATMRTDIKGIRDASILLFGLAAALRRGEMARLRVEDLKWSDHGVTCTITGGKTDQHKQGEQVAVPFAPAGHACPVRALRLWLDKAGITSGPVWRFVDRWGRVHDDALDAKSVNLIVKECASVAGLDASHLGAHSLRAGFATSCADVGIRDADAMRHGRWKCSETFNAYVRRRGDWRDNPAGLLF